MRYLSICFLLCLTALVHAQSLPSIDAFTVDNAVLDYAAVEGGYATANFSWQASGLRAGDTMEMHAWVNGDWGLIGEGFEPVKTDTLVIAHPLSYELPRYRLSIVDNAGQRLVESFLELQYAAPTGLPSISYFATRSYPITSSRIQNNQGVVMHWRVYNRWHRSNLYFEQVLLDGTVIAIAENTPEAWRRASDEGTLYPEYAGDGHNVMLRLRVVNIDTGETLSSFDTLLVLNHDSESEIELIDFNISPSVGILNGRATLSWEVANATRVFIGQRTPLRSNVGECKKNGGYQNEIIYEDLPPTGSLEIQIPEEAYGAIRFQIVADYYYTGVYSCEPQPLLGEIFLELENYSRYSPILQSFEFTTATRAVAGDSFPISWSAREGQAVMIIQTSGWNSFNFTTFEASEGVEIFDNLPLTGSMTLQIPNTLDIRREPQHRVYLFLRRADAVPELLWSHEFSIDRDDNLNCESFIALSTTAATPASDIEITWDSCGTDPVELEHLWVYEEENGVFQELAASTGSMNFTLPNRTGFLVFVLYRLFNGERVELLRTSLQID